MFDPWRSYAPTQINIPKYERV